MVKFPETVSNLIIGEVIALYHSKDSGAKLLASGVVDFIGIWERQPRVAEEQSEVDQAMADLDEDFDQEEIEAGECY